MLVIGIDPGNSGAVAVLIDRELVDTYDMPVVDKLVSEHLLVALLRNIEGLYGTPTVCVIEKVASRPGQGVASVFKFGMAYGIQRCAPMALGWSTELVTPTRWKKALGLSSDKEQSRRRAIEMWPSMAHYFDLKKHQDRAEAALIGYWWVTDTPAGWLGTFSRGL